MDTVSHSSIDFILENITFSFLIFFMISSVLLDRFFRESKLFCEKLFPHEPRLPVSFSLDPSFFKIVEKFGIRLF